MKDLIEAITIMMKYCGNDKYPTHCEHDVLYFPNVDYDEVSDEDKKRLEELGFVENTEFGSGFMSYRFGSC
jgi:hypothetical protein